ncbi:hypothetical protein BDD43_2211 [Mucilaginibacter gracilis]|uniref:Uncharacterized protein n=1 Tax=Mucilaginibacter gracilis TaxID=423350 RepID=A0A495J161_9SPHI|nr:hypothetical protein [Mucilaginibacter gracilis]RKR82044.1 hypothetical protein BDD43_2211 [Mucilaginibacter gracilis]
MKTSIFFIIITSSCVAQNRYTINVDIENSNGKTIYLTDGYGGPLDRPKSMITETQCLFTGPNCKATDGQGCATYAYKSDTGREDVTDAVICCDEF